MSPIYEITGTYIEMVPYLCLYDSWDIICFSFFHSLSHSSIKIFHPLKFLKFHKSSICLVKLVEYDTTYYGEFSCYFSDCLSALFIRCTVLFNCLFASVWFRASHEWSVARPDQAKDPGWVIGHIEAQPAVSAAGHRGPDSAGGWEHPGARSVRAGGTCG